MAKKSPNGKKQRTLRKDQDEMPEVLRDKPIVVSPQAVERQERAQTPMWYRVTMFGLMVLGLLWAVTFYIMQGAGPVEAWGQGNIFASFGLIFAGFLMMMRWR